MCIACMHTCMCAGSCVYTPTARRIAAPKHPSPLSPVNICIDHYMCSASLFSYCFVVPYYCAIYFRTFSSIDISPWGSENVVGVSSFRIYVQMYYQSILQLS